LTEIDSVILNAGILRVNIGGTAQVKAKGAYSRKVSSEEAGEGYILILRSKLHLFPHLGKEFDLVQNDISKRRRWNPIRAYAGGLS
jgi:hypothetical protein